MKKVTFDDLMTLKNKRSMSIINGDYQANGEPTWYDYIITATTKKDFIMDVWNGIHPVEENSHKHLCKAGTRVRIWMVSRFGDAGITDNLKNPNGYDCRNVDVDKDLEDIKLERICRDTKSQSVEPLSPSRA